MWITWIAVDVIALILAGAIVKIVRDKKKGVKCIGCPAAHGCSQDERTPCGNCTYQPNDK